MKIEPSMLGYGSSTGDPKQDASFHRDAMGLDEVQEAAALERAREQYIHRGEHLAEAFCEGGDNRRALAIFSLLFHTWPNHPRCAFWQERLSSLGS